MQIRIKKPSATQATWAIVDNGNELVITPYFRTKSCTQTIAHVEFHSDNGAVIPGVLVVNAKASPKLGYRPFDADKLVRCPFDSVELDEVKTIPAAD